MANLPQSRPQWRYPRAHLEGHNPAVLRFANGKSVGGNLQVISVTGGLLSLPQPVVQGTQARLIFLTGSGAVLGGAEMLPPLGTQLQPFRFVSLEADAHRRLGTLVYERTIQSKAEHDWIEKLRSASLHEREHPFWRFKLAGVIGLLAMGLATAGYLVHFGLMLQ
jgi:hypothetical protein